MLLATSAHAQTAETLAPGSNHPSGTVTVGGTGFGDDEAVDIYFDTTDEQLAVTGGTGAFSGVPITVPAAALPGTHYITAIGRRTGDAAQKDFTVRTNWPQFGEGARERSANLYENVLSATTVGGLDLSWSVAGAGGSTAAIYNGTLYVGAGSGALTAINATTGATIWTASTGGIEFSSPAVAGNLVIVGSEDSNIYAFDTGNGALVWKYQTGNIVDSSPSVANGIVYAGSYDGKMYALNASTGALVWSYNAGAQISTFGQAVANGKVYFATYGKAYALNAATGVVVWTSTSFCNCYILTTPTVADGAVFWGDDGGVVHSLNAGTGAVNWTATTGGEIGTNLAVSNGLVYASSADGNVYAYNMQTGLESWQFSPGTGLGVGNLSVANGVLYAAGSGSSGGHVYALSAPYGYLLFSAEASAAVVGTPLVANGMLYFSDFEYGDFYAYALGAGGTARVTPPSIAALRALQRK